jgi:hypothetical protein
MRGDSQDSAGRGEESTVGGRKAEMALVASSFFSFFDCLTFLT